MKVCDNTYVNIKIKDLGIENFLQPNDLLDLQIIETAGTSLPVVYASFFTAEQKIINHFIANNTVIVELGETEEDCDSFVVSIFSSTPPNNGAQGNRRLVEFGGFIINQDYMINFETKTYLGNSMLVAHKVLYDYFGIKPGNGLQTNIFRTNENQVRWRRTNQTACLFLAETLVHMDIMPSFPLFAFDKYGTFHLNDFNSVVKGNPAAKFVSGPPKETNEIRYINNFSIEDFKDSYNLYSGYNKITEIWGANSGMVQYAKSYNEPVLASTQETDMVESSSRMSTNTIQSANVHDTYVEAFVYNSNKLMALSSMQGALQLIGKYHKNLKPTDLVTVTTGDADISIDGSYLIDTIRTQVDMKRGGVIHTYVYVTRDNKNNIENYVANPKKGLKIKKKWFTDVMNAVSQLRVAYAVGQQVMDGRFMKRMLSFGIETKRSLLRSFNIAGSPVDFNSSALLVKSLISSGNSLMNSLTSMIFPEQIAGVLKDFIIRKPSLRALFGKYIAMYVPYELMSIVTAISDSIFKTTDSLNSIAKDNGISVVAVGSGGSAASTTNSITANIGGTDTVIDDTNTSEIDYTSDNQERVKDIITDFENNTSGLSIPFPIVDLTESQALMSDSELRNYLANQTITNLSNLGYLTLDELNDFKNILLGVTPIDFNMIDKINKNAGNSYNYRFWGTFGQSSNNDATLFAWKAKDKYVYTLTTQLRNDTTLYSYNGMEYSENDFIIEYRNGSYTIVYIEDDTEALRDPSKDQRNSSLTELTAFKIKKSYKDKFRTIPCTKIVNATRNAKLFFACPASEKDLKFYINSKRLELVDNLEQKEGYANKAAIGYFPIDLGYTDVYGNIVMYNVYYTNTGYNSTGVLFEVKQGGMV